ncbi:sensor histidine kinase [Actinomadura miaoliensis]|uniref:histidine kinase n=1 Tax=Actinomadura miaoliensis TaxID=430685 RepID=A0ABP7V2X3_9ACTN
MSTSADRAGVDVDGAAPPPPQRRRGPFPRLLRTSARTLAGLCLGAVSAVVELVLLAVAGPLVVCALAFSRGRRPVPRVVTGAATALTGLERRRLTVFLGHEQPAGYEPVRALVYLLLRVPVGLLGGIILTLTTYGAGAMTALVFSWSVSGDYLDHIPPEPGIVAYMLVMAAVLLFLAVQGLIGVAVLERGVARRCLGPSPLEQYERRIAQLAVSRAAVVEAVDDERRRIERDLHDGVQQRLVALGMLIGRARRAGDAERTRELLRQAHEESQRALGDLREVAWRVYPAALDREGLRAALETVAERSSVPVTIDYDVAGRPPHAVETAAYFVVCEAVTNAAKHSGASRVTVRVADGPTGEAAGGVVGGVAGAAGAMRTLRDDAAETGSNGMIFVRVEDDGAGGADPAGTGLAGLARRVAALDGAFAVDSPSGGPTVIRAALPCG